MSIIDVVKIKDAKELRKPFGENEIRLSLIFFLDKPLLFRLKTQGSIDGYHIMELVSRSICKRLNISKKDYEDFGQIGISLVASVKHLGHTKQIKFNENTIITTGSEVYLEILPTGDTAVDFAKGAIGGATTAVALLGGVGALNPVGLALVAGAAILGGAGNAFIGHYTRTQTANAQAEQDAAAASLNQVQDIKQLQPIKIREIEKIESKELKEFLTTNRIEPDSPIPEIFGKIRVRPGAMTPFYVFDKHLEDYSKQRERYEYKYQATFNVGEGPIDISDYKLGEGITPYDFDNWGSTNRGEFDIINLSAYEGIGSNQNIITLPTKTINNGVITIPQNDAAGVWATWAGNQRDSRVNIDLSLRTTAPPASTDFTFLGQSNNVKYHWLNTFFINPQTSYATLAEAQTAAAGNPLRLISNLVNGRYYVLTPKSNSSVPLFLFETTLNNISGVSDNIPNGFTIQGKKANSVYSFTMPSFEDFTNPDFFNRIDFTASSPVYNKKNISAFRIMRVSYQDVSNNTINLSSLGHFPSTHGTGHFRQLFLDLYFSRGESDYNPAREEAIIYYREEINTPRTPGVPEFPEAPFWDYTGSRYETATAYGTGSTTTSDGRGGTKVVSVTFPVDYQRMAQQYANELRAHNNRVEDYNNEVIEIQKKHQEDVEDYRRYLAEFNEHFNRLSRGMGSFSILAERKVRNILGGSETSYVKSRNPADIVLAILYKFILRSDIGLALDDLVDIGEFRIWKTFCATQDLSFDGVFDFETTLFDAIGQVAFVGFADLDFSTGRIRPIIKTTRTMIKQHFHSRNLTGLTMTKTNIEPPHALTGQFIDSSKDYKQDQETIYTGNKTAQTARTEERFSLFGVASREQALKYLIYQRNIYASTLEVYNFQTSLEGVVARRGDLVALNHYEIEPSNFSCKIRKVIPDPDQDGYILGFQIDQYNVPELDQSVTYVCTIISSDNVATTAEIKTIEDSQIYDSEETLYDQDNLPIVTREDEGEDEILSRPVKRKAIILKEPLRLKSFGQVNAGLIEQGNEVIFGKQTTSLKLCLVRSLSLDKSLNVSMSLVSYNESVYNLS